MEVTAVLYEILPFALAQTKHGGEETQQKVLALDIDLSFYVEIRPIVIHQAIVERGEEAHSFHDGVSLGYDSSLAAQGVGHCTFPVIILCCCHFVPDYSLLLPTYHREGSWRGRG